MLPSITLSTRLAVCPRSSCVLVCTPRQLTQHRVVTKWLYTCFPPVMLVEQFLSYMRRWSRWRLHDVIVHFCSRMMWIILNIETTWAWSDKHQAAFVHMVHRVNRMDVCSWMWCGAMCYLWWATCDHDDIILLEALSSLLCDAFRNKWLQICMINRTNFVGIWWNITTNRLYVCWKIIHLHNSILY